MNLPTALQDLNLSDDPKIQFLKTIDSITPLINKLPKKPEDFGETLDSSFTIPEVNQKNDDALESLIEVHDLTRKDRFLKYEKRRTKITQLLKQMQVDFSIVINFRLMLMKFIGRIIASPTSRPTKRLEISYDWRKLMLRLMHGRRRCVN